MAMAFVGCSEHDGVVYSGDSAVYAFAGATQKVEIRSLFLSIAEQHRELLLLN